MNSLAQPKRWISETQTGSSSFVNVADFTLRRMRSAGISVKPGSRLLKARQLVHKIETGSMKLAPNDDQLLSQLAEAQLCIIQMSTIAKTFLRRHKFRWSIIEKCQTMLSGADMPSQDSNSIGRNTQFELYVGAILDIGGTGVWLDEPDWRIRNGLLEAGIACKRLTSTKQFKRRMSEASKQIDNTGLPGFVAINMDAFIKKIDQNNSPDPDVLFNDFIDEVCKQQYSTEIAEEVLGVLHFGHVTEFDFTGKKPLTKVHNMHNFIMTARTVDDFESWTSRLSQINNRLNERL